jgi:hypothetical protein
MDSQIKKYANLKSDFHEYIINNADKPWDYGMLSKNPNITWKIVRDNPDKSWYGLSENRNITWDYMGLSLNRNITWEIVRDNQDKP